MLSVMDGMMQVLLYIALSSRHLSYVFFLHNLKNFALLESLCAQLNKNRNCEIKITKTNLQLISPQNS